MRSTFEEIVLQQKMVFRKIDVFWLCWRVVLGVSEKISVSLQGFWLGTVAEDDERVLIKLSVQSD